jgi:hypothetical protein
VLLADTLLGLFAWIAHHRSDLSIRSVFTRGT